MPVLQFLGVADEAQSEARKAWRRLNGRTRRQVVRLARHGRQHPDPKVSATALAWASEQHSQPLSRVAIGAVVFALSYVAVAWVFSLTLHWNFTQGSEIGGIVGAAATYLASTWIQQRLARKVVAANRFASGNGI